MKFESAVGTLWDAGVDFVIVGGLAAIFHGGDSIHYVLEVCYSRTPTNLSRLTEALAAYNPHPRGLSDDVQFVWNETILKSDRLLKLETDLGSIDLANEVKGLGDYDAVKNRSLEVEAFGRRIWSLNLTTLIDAKRTSGTQRDLLELHELESLLEAEEP